jgi:hypothetical protein
MKQFTVVYIGTVVSQLYSMLKQGVTPFDDSVGVPLVHILCFYWARAQHRQSRVEFLMRRRLQAEGIVAKIEVEKMANPIAWCVWRGVYGVVCMAWCVWYQLACLVPNNHSLTQK